MKQLTESLALQGYILVPKALLKQQSIETQQGDLEAFLRIIIHVNYSDTTYNIKGEDICCHRGESLISQRHWSYILKWTRPRTARFMLRLCKEELIEIIPHENEAFHIRIVNYDLWTGQFDHNANHNSQQDNSLFDIFWKQYHEITQKPKKNIARARHEWVKLDKNQQQLAIDRIEEFYYHIDNVRFIPLASTYLKDQAFLDEYTD